MADALVGREPVVSVNLVPGRLLSQPHRLAEELRAPLTVLAGWHSLIRDGDIGPASTPCEWERAMAACDAAVVRLNRTIAQACDEAGALILVDVRSDAAG